MPFPLVSVEDGRSGKWGIDFLCTDSGDLGTRTSHLGCTMLPHWASVPGISGGPARWPMSLSRDRQGWRQHHGGWRARGIWCSSCHLLTQWPSTRDIDSVLLITDDHRNPHPSGRNKGYRWGHPCIGLSTMSKQKERKMIFYLLLLP